MLKPMELDTGEEPIRQGDLVMEVIGHGRRITLNPKYFNRSLENNIENISYRVVLHFRINPLKSALCVYILIEGLFRDHGPR